MAISLLQAKTLALAAVGVAPIKRVMLPDALGRFLAEPVSAKQASPPFDSSAIEGYALASSDAAAARRERPVHVKLMGELDASSLLPDRDLKPGEAMRVRAGAPVPFGADAVAPAEHSTDDGQRVTFFSEVPPGANVRRRGEEWQAGELLMPAGHPIDAQTVAVLISLGITDVPVRPWTKVAVFAPGEGTMTEALLLLMSSLLEQAGIEVVAVERCAEREEAIAGMLERFVPRADIVVACPAATLSGRDQLKTVLKRVGGTLGFDGVAMKPGRHTALAMLKGKPIAILPAPGIAVMAAFDHLLKPMLMKRHGVIEKRRRMTVQLAAPIRKLPGRTMLVPAKLELRGNERLAHFRAPVSTYLSGALGADGWLVLPAEHAEYKQGDTVDLELNFASTFTVLPSSDEDEATR